MKKASAVFSVQLLLALAVPASARSGLRGPSPAAAGPAVSNLAPRTHKSFGHIDTNRDGVISKKEFVLGGAPAAAPGAAPGAAPVPAPGPAAAMMHSQAPAKKQKKAPAGLEPGAPAPATAPAKKEKKEKKSKVDNTTTKAEDQRLIWPKAVEPGTKQTTKNVTFHPKSGKVVGVWHTEDASVWKDDKSKMPKMKNVLDADDKKEVKKAVKAASEPVKPPKADNAATAAAKNAVALGADTDSVVAAAAGASGDKLPAVTLTFELKNINYHMLDEPGYRSPAIGRHNALDQNKFSLAQAGGPVDVEPMTLEDGEEHEATNGELIEGAIKQTLEQLLAIAFGDVSSVEADEDVPDHIKKHVTIGHKVLALPQEEEEDALSGAPAGAPSVSGLAPSPGPAEVAPFSPMSAPMGPPSEPTEPKGHNKGTPSEPKGLDPKETVQMRARESAAGAPAPAPASSPGPMKPRFKPHPALPKIGVSFLPGRSVDQFEEQGNAVQPVPTSSMFVRHAKRRLRRHRIRARRGHTVEALSTIAKVELVASRLKPAHDLDSTRKALSMYVMDGTLSEALAAALAAAVDMTPIVGVIEEDVAQVSPYNVSTCATHIHKLISGFEQAYTRRQVPQALYTACTHYGQKMSFSHDPIIDNSDRHKCRVATKRFTNLWQYGKGKVDYSRFCLQLCELRNGQDSIQCDAYKHFGRPGAKKSEKKSEKKNEKKSEKKSDEKSEEED